MEFCFPRATLRRFSRRAISALRCGSSDRSLMGSSFWDAACIGRQLWIEGVEVHSQFIHIDYH